MTDSVPILVEFDPEADALFVRLREYTGTTSGRQLDEYRIVHVDERGEAVAVELIFVTRGIDLEGLPHGDEIARALRAFPRLAAV